MGRSGNIGWGISNYFGLPNRKRKLLTKEFLQTFKEEIIKLENEFNKKHNRLEIDYEKESYDTFYSQIEGTGTFYEALKKACEKHKLVKAIYEYSNKLPWYDSDCFNGDLTLEMVSKGVIEYDNPNDYTYDDEDELDEDYNALYKLVRHNKGYNVVEYGRWFNDDRQGLEDCYKDSEKELIWLN